LFFLSPARADLRLPSINAFAGLSAEVLSAR